MSTPAQEPAEYVVLDACVLMSTLLRRMLLRAAEAGVFQPVWSARIGDEWRRNAARLWESTSADTLMEEWQRMQGAFPDADPGAADAYEVGLRYSDPKDFHVIATGLAKRARSGDQLTPRVSVLTWNLKDFNRSECRRLGLQVYSPDRLLAAWWPDHREALLAATEGLAIDWAAMGRTPVSLASILHRERLYRYGKLAADSLSDAGVDYSPSPQ